MSAQQVLYSPEVDQNIGGDDNQPYPRLVKFLAFFENTVSHNQGCKVPTFNTGLGLLSEQSTTIRLLTMAALFSSSKSIMSLILRSSRSEEHTSELQSRENLVCRLLLEK